MSFLIQNFARSQPLLVVSVSELVSHVLDYVNFGWNFSFNGPTFGKESLDLWTVLLNIVVIDILYTIDVVGWWLVQIVVETESSADVRAKV